MHVELVDLFRCPRPHADTWLVASADRTESRVIIDGLLGCPVCGAEYPIVDTVADFRSAQTAADFRNGSTAADFRSDSTAADFSGASTAADFRSASAVFRGDSRDRDGESMLAPDQALRLAAMLDLTEPGRTVLLYGGSHDIAHSLQEVVPTRVVLVNSPAKGAVAYGDTIAASITCDASWPVAPRSVDGVAILAAPDDNLASAVRALRANGRLAAPVSSMVPEGVNEIARDHLDWVAAREEAGPIVTLLRNTTPR